MRYFPGTVCGASAPFTTSVPDSYRSSAITSASERCASTSASLASVRCCSVTTVSMSVDSLEPCGVYFGTSGGQVYASADAGDSWVPIVRDLPPVLSVEVQTLPRRGD